MGGKVEGRPSFSITNDSGNCKRFVYFRTNETDPAVEISPN